MSHSPVTNMTIFVHSTLAAIGVARDELVYRALCRTMLFWQLSSRRTTAGGTRGMSNAMLVNHHAILHVI